MSDCVLRNRRGDNMSYFVFALKRVYDSGRPPLRQGEFRTREEAWAASRRMIDEYLQRESASCPSAQALYERFRRHAAVPFICSDVSEDHGGLDFNPLKYALMRCEEMCGEAQACA